MSGHSKWNNIKRKKEKTDGARAKIFTKIGRELAVAVKEGGADPMVNSKLKDCIAKAKANNVPNDNIERIIKKAAGSADGEKYEAITYEGYGPSGVAVIVETLTDNRNRTAGDLRHYFDKFGGNLGTPGCVSFMFSKKGVIVVEKTDLNEDKVMEDALEAGALDFLSDENVFEIYTDPDDFSSIREALEKKNYEFVSAEIEMVPSTYSTIVEEENATKMQKLLDTLDDNDDVQNVWHNWEEPQE
ncbi:probable transcriptional regulatory protein CLOLEP_02910 [Clostridium sp. CAG:557]|jgi:YebC/PmpR family DNA-binding regulatory protein|nr:probable transcriptional regulatory protein CLOLEP_02910 [Clostridium sp. CAG:557]